jgi:hypothetical protein
MVRERRHRCVVGRGLNVRHARAKPATVRRAWMPAARDPRRPVRGPRQARSGGSHRSPRPVLPQRTMAEVPRVVPAGHVRGPRLLPRRGSRALPGLRRGRQDDARSRLRPHRPAGGRGCRAGPEEHPRFVPSAPLAADDEGADRARARVSRLGQGGYAHPISGRACLGSARRRRTRERRFPKVKIACEER